jgi:Bacterial PH domain
MSLDIYSCPEHEFEPELGLPERLPKGERILWQGSPDTKAILLKVFHIKILGIYFGLLLAYRFVTGFNDGEPIIVILFSAAIILALSSLGLGLIALIGYLIASTAVYTITNKRVVMRIGIVLNMTFNFPLKRIESADCGLTKDGTGDIYLKLGKGDKIAIFHLWPHARPGYLATPQPTLRGIQNCAEVAQILVDAWAIENNVMARTVQTNQVNAMDAKNTYSGAEAA